MTPEVVLTSIQLVLARPEAADLRKIHYYAAETGAAVEEVSYIVKLYLGSPPVSNSMGLELYVGDQKIRKYSQFSHGIYFKINDPQQLPALEGQEVRFRRPGAETFINTRVSFPRDIDERRADESVRTHLPTQAEVLRE
jgi:hypothetical protein